MSAARHVRRKAAVLYGLCDTPSDTLYYKTHVSIYVLLAGLPAA
jgi:hypothetical protein